MIVEERRVRILSECIPKSCALKNICSFYTEQEKSSRDESFSLFNDWLRN